MNKDLKEREPFNLKLSFLIAIIITVVACLIVLIIGNKGLKTLVFQSHQAQSVDLEDIPMQQFQKLSFPEAHFVGNQPAAAQIGAEAGQTMAKQAGAIGDQQFQIAAGAADVYDFSDVEIRPIPIQKYCIQAEYPESLKKMKVEGTVIIEGVIDTTGLVIAAKVMSSIHPLLDESALKAFKQWRFFPAKQRDKAVKVKLMVPMRFSLEE